MTGWDRLLDRGRGLFRVDLGPILALPAPLRPGSWDKWLLGASAGLVLFGLATVYSATAPTASRATAYLESHLVRLILGVGAFALGSRIDYHRWGRWAPGLYLLGLASLLLVYMPGVGHSAGNARRWISIGGFTLQQRVISLDVLQFHAQFLTGNFLQLKKIFFY
jgi:cell division protein FtsW (lipid II flippase)